MPSASSNSIRRLLAADGAIANQKQIVEELLENRHKALVFSQFVDHLNIVRAWLDEQQVAARLLEGLTSKEIGRTLEISHRTVEIYRARLMRKYNASTAADLVHKLLAGG